MRNRLYYLGKPDDGFGWGVANTNLVKALGEFCEVIVDQDPNRTRFDAPVFVPIIDSALRPIRKVKAPRVLGYAFTEWPIEDGAFRTARQYDVLFCGSTWNKERLVEAGCRNVDVLIQGIDPTVFKPLPPSQRKGFVVFSGGKYEYRKGQDIVLAAMRAFMGVHGDVTLIAAWHNQWKDSMLSMQNSWLINPDNPVEGISQDRLFLLPPVPNAKTPEIYAQAHVGLFPNRCEAGTNLVMCEFMACSRPVIASFAHGHRDVLSGDGPFLLDHGDYDPAGWFNPPICDTLAALECAYKNRDELAARGRACAQLTEALTWKSCAEKVFLAAFPGQGVPDRASESPAETLNSHPVS